MVGAEIHIEIVSAQPATASVARLRLPAGSCVADALVALIAHPQFAAIDWSSAPLGIFGRRVSREQVLKEGDRIEIYRPLAQEPKLARRNRVSKSARS